MSTSVNDSSCRSVCQVYQRLIEIPNYSCMDRNWSKSNVNIKKDDGVCYCIKSDLIYSYSEFLHYNLSTKNI